MGTSVVARGIASSVFVIGNVLRAEETRTKLTFHFWLSSRSGRCCRANQSFYCYATSISSYRACPALSSEHATPLPIRHRVRRDGQSLFPVLPPPLQSSGRSDAVQQQL